MRGFAVSPAPMLEGSCDGPETTTEVWRPGTAGSACRDDHLRSAGEKERWRSATARVFPRLWDLVMNRAEIERAVREALKGIVPDVDADAIDPNRNFRDQCEFDSMDFLSLMMDLDKRLGIHISETDYPKLSNLASCVQYIEQQLESPSGEG